MRLIRWGVSALAATLVATVLVAPANAATGLTVTVNITHDAAPVTGGCVDIYEVGEHLAFDAECADAGGVVTFTGVGSGTYELHVRGFNGGLANIWYGGSVGRSGAADVVVDEDNLNLAVDLPDGASITGELGGDFQGAKVSVFTPDLELVSTSDVNGDGSWEVGQLAAGEYYVWYYGFNAKAGAWYKTGSAPDHGSRTLVTVDPGSGPAYLDFTPSSSTTNVYGNLNPPLSWDVPTVCLGAYLADAPGTVQTWECGQPGTPFHLVGLTVGQYYKFRLMSEQPASVAEWASTTATDVWFGNVAIEPSALDIPMQHAVPEQYLPLAFFTDVTHAVKGFWEISWMSDSGITTGYDDGSFRPFGTVKRQDMARFLYRQAGEPSVTLPASSPFVDVAETSDAYTAIVWLGQQGITQVNPFHPTNSVSRKQMVMFLYRALGEPPVTLPSRSPFKDVAKTDLGYQAVVWAQKAGVTTGYDDGTFRPNKPVIRSHMALFMYRAWHVTGD